MYNVICYLLYTVVVHSYLLFVVNAPSAPVLLCMYYGAEKPLCARLFRVENLGDSSNLEAAVCELSLYLADQSEIRGRITFWAGTTNARVNYARLHVEHVALVVHVIGDSR